MTKEEKFANDMSILLSEMRGEDLTNTTIYTFDDKIIPDEFIDSILDDKKHLNEIKKRIYNSVLEAVQFNPKLFLNKKGEYEYTAPHTYNHTYMVDGYLEEQYLSTKTHTLLICSHCNSSNVQVKAWVKPNLNNRFVTIDNDQNEAGWCCDCELYSHIISSELKLNARIIGYQVVGREGTKQEGDIHPDMYASFCVYSLEDAREMIKTNKNEWQLLTIWDGDIEEPTIMFE